MILNLRGTNGSGKTTVARFFITRQSVAVALTEVPLRSGKKKPIIGYVGPSVAVVGSYENACGGMDGIPDFETARNAITAAANLAQHVVAEGILASTVYGSWAQYARGCGRPFAFVYLTTPLETCIERVKNRILARGAEPIFNQGLLRDKFVAIARTRERAIKDGHHVFDLPLDNPEFAAKAILSGEGEAYRATA